MHFLAKIPKTEGAYHVRIYDMPNGSYKMSEHAWKIFADAPVEISGDLVFADGFGDAQSAFENELLQGAVEHQNFSISLDADPIFKTLVAAWRNLKKEVWMEIVLETDAIIDEKLKHHVMIQPRKKRLFWWGKLTRNEATGYVDYQAYKKGLIRDPKVPVHIGGLEMNFVHWLHWRFEQPAEEFLDLFIGAHGSSSFVQFSRLFYSLCQYISPTALNLYADQRLICTDLQDGVSDYDSISHCNFDWNIVLDNDAIPLIEATDLANQGFLTHYPGVPLSRVPTWNKQADGDHGEYSLYTRWKKLGDALVMLSREFVVKFDQEMPILEDVYKMYKSLGSPNYPLTNKKHERQVFPNACGRWVFWRIADSPIEATALPIKKTIKYTPAATWLRSLEITMPQFYDGELVYYRHTHSEYAKRTSEHLEGQEIKYETIWSFVGVQRDNHSAELLTGVEMRVRNKNNHAQKDYARHIKYIDYAGRQVIDAWHWTDYHMLLQWALWGGGDDTARALVEFEQDGAGIVPYDKSIGSFGLLDYGDFGNMRWFYASPGLLYDDSVAGNFAIIEIGHTPGGNRVIKGIEKDVVSYSTIDFTRVEVPEPEDPGGPPVITVPPEVGEPISGVHDLWLVANDPEGCIDHVDFLIDGVFQARLPGGSAYWQRFDFWFDTTAFTNGAHTLMVIITDCDGNVTSQIYVFFINN